MPALPRELDTAIERESQNVSLAALRGASADLTAAYRDRTAIDVALADEARRIAYVVVRMPATFAVLYRVLTESAVQRAVPEAKSLLDIGAGPGTTGWAAAQAFPHLSRIVNCEPSAAMAELGQRIAASSSAEVVRDSGWLMRRLADLGHEHASEVVVASYVFNELNENELAVAADRLWQLTRNVLIIVDAGTSESFSRLRTVRERLIAAGARMIAPCPHGAACPMQGADWCHFSVRVARTSLHRAVKGAVLGHEDEKFSYLVAARNNAAWRPSARVVKKPIRAGGHVHLDLCADGLLSRTTISRRQGPLYRRARDMEWGDAWEV
jgi:ribosomal protein RSM22 (predicted rRNA methylase)